MDDFSLTTPVAFFIFNRPDTTTRVFEQIRQAKPAKLLVVADGPRVGQPADGAKCAATRAIIDQVDWDCEVLTNYADVNLGCKIRMATGLDWVFSTVDEAIILEHDTLPHPSFFRYCQELLEHYRDDKRIMTISGCNFQFGRRRTGYSYYFSRCVHCWGWATWRRAWQYYDVGMVLWPEVAGGGWLASVLSDRAAAAYWYRIFELTYRGYVNTWDYQWVFTCWSQNSLTIIPNVNLVANIGFGAEGIHTTNCCSRVANLPTEPMNFPLRHPPFMLRDTVADDFTQQLYNTGEM
ncbi:hemolytic protein HlpA-like protein [Sporolituus thermophilus]|uniref:Hemolytic protein HlpA-like protein n=1 Tax=Sporolituus thermophilus DSM 23256 TaxID=1123285 RepID=A0A1G7LW91_9FIRM|nr:hemolytic protein HlpA-like protein [Sporolituus thermophilus]SDF53713.1 hypothetical protein SAMN05660235_01916 [Sporolituus thermophilus DSM 23256]